MDAALSAIGFVLAVFIGYGVSGLLIGSSNKRR